MTATDSSTTHPIAEAAQRAASEAAAQQASELQAQEETRRQQELETARATAREAAQIAEAIFEEAAGAAGDPDRWATSASKWLPPGVEESASTVYVEVPHPAAEPIRYLFRHREGASTLEVAARANLPGELHFVPFRDLTQLGWHLRAGGILTEPPVRPPTPDRTAEELLLRAQDVFDISGQRVETECGLGDRRITVRFPQSGAEQTFELKLVED